MAQNVISKSFSELHPVVKNTIWVVGIGVAIYATYKIYKAVQKAKETAKDKASMNQVRDELIQLTSQDIPQSYTDSQYLSWAGTILNKLNSTGGCVTDNAGIASIIVKMKNDVDWLKLVEAFGIKTVSGCGFVSDRQVTLQEGLNWKLEQVVVDALNSFLQKRGSKYRI